VSIHQSNYAKILSLRDTSNALDTKIRETLTLLTETRRALISTPSTAFPPTSNPVSYSELLSYARRISKFTLPSTFREPDTTSAVGAVEGAPGTNTPKESKSETQTNGTTTPVAVTNGVDKDVQMNSDAAMDIDSATPSGVAQTSQDTMSSSISLPNNFSQWLNPLADLPFIPWPTEDAIRRGALASIQVLLDQGVDPATFDPEKSAELEAERKRIMEEEDRIRDEERARMEEERRRELERRMSAGGPVGGERREERPKVFQLETFDDDDED